MAVGSLTFSTVLGSNASFSPKFGRGPAAGTQVVVVGSAVGGAPATVEGVAVWWKIDLYDADYDAGSELRDDLAVTRRVLTILLPEEY